MKKLFLSILAIVLCANMFAAVTYTDKVSITIYDGTYFPSLIVGESADAEFAGGVLVNGYYAPVQNIASMPLAIYAYRDGVEYENLILSSLENIPMGIKTNNATSYTLYFAGLQGAVSIYDKQEDEWIDCSAAYPFTIDGSQCNSYINNRFYFFYNAASFHYTVNLNAYGMATFSAAERTVVPAGLKAYAAGNLSGTELTLTEVAGPGDYIPANTGVLLYGEQSGNPYAMTIDAGDAAAFAGNMFHAASEWTASLENVYILHGNELWQYTGTEFAPNKAYLQISMPAGTSYAPKRISMHFDAATGVENVETVAPVEKFMQEGQVLIRRGENVYNLQGQIIK